VLVGRRQVVPKHFLNGLLAAIRLSIDRFQVHLRFRLFGVKRNSFGIRAKALDLHLAFDKVILLLFSELLQLVPFLHLVNHGPKARSTHFFLSDLNFLDERAVPDGGVVLRDRAVPM
jgi:hypothetical protein